MSVPSADPSCLGQRHFQWRMPVPCLSVLTSAPSQSETYVCAATLAVQCRPPICDATWRPLFCAATASHSYSLMLYLATLIVFDGTDMSSICTLQKILTKAFRSHACGMLFVGSLHRMLWKQSVFVSELHGLLAPDPYAEPAGLHRI